MKALRLAVVVVSVMTTSGLAKPNHKIQVMHIISDQGLPAIHIIPATYNSTVHIHPLMAMGALSSSLGDSELLRPPPLPDKETAPGGEGSWGDEVIEEEEEEDEEEDNSSSSSEEEEGEKPEEVPYVDLPPWLKVPIDKYVQHLMKEGVKGQKGDSGVGLKGEPGVPGMVVQSSGKDDIGQLKHGDHRQYYTILKGEPGTKGEPGSAGTAGTAGAKGDPGEKGAGGTAGSNGSNGADGADGAAGPRGAKGAPGAVGPKGSQGDPGADGVDGVNGAKGAKGAAGSAGQKGEPGP